MGRPRNHSKTKKGTPIPLIARRVRAIAEKAGHTPRDVLDEIFSQERSEWERSKRGRLSKSVENIGRDLRRVAQYTSAISDLFGSIGLWGAPQHAGLGLNLLPGISRMVAQAEKDLKRIRIGKGKLTNQVPKRFEERLNAASNAYMCWMQEHAERRRGKGRAR